MRDLMTRTRLILAGMEPQHLYAGGAPYKSFHKDSPVLWEDFRFVSPMMTDGAGEAEKTVEHGYHYDKTFCDGHPGSGFWCRFRRRKRMRKPEKLKTRQR